MFFSCSNHSWVSFQGFAESYNDGFRIERGMGMFENSRFDMLKVDNLLRSPKHLAVVRNVYTLYM